MQVLKEQELGGVSGGFWAQVLVAIAVYDAVTDFAEGFAAGSEAGFADGMKK